MKNNKNSKNNKNNSGGGWFVYVVRCADDTLYTGITTDIARRIGEHNAGRPIGARYTDTRRPVKLVYHECRANRAAAARREFELRNLSKPDKEKLVA